MTHFSIYTYTMLIALLVLPGLHGLQIGSDSQVSRQQFIHFNDNDQDHNRMLGFGCFSHGFSLGGPQVGATFDSSFHVGGDIYLEGGSLHLASDLVFSNTFNIRSNGKIMGNNHKVVLSPSDVAIIIPDTVPTQTEFTLVDERKTKQRVYSCEWSFDGEYLAVASDTHQHKVEIFSFDGNSLSPIAVSSKLDGRVYSLSYHPTDDYIACAQYSNKGEELVILRWDRATKTLLRVDGVALDCYASAVSWHPNGKYVALGTLNSTDQVRIYAFNNQSLTLATKSTLSPHRSIVLNGMHWDRTGSFLAVATYYAKTQGASELIIYSFTQVEESETIEKVQELDVGQGARAVRWAPHESLLAVGYYTGKQRLRLYGFDTQTFALEEYESARINQCPIVFSVDWSPDAGYIVIGEGNAANSGFKIYRYDSLEKSFMLEKAVPCSCHVFSTRWSSDGRFIVRGDYSKALHVYAKESSSAISSLVLEDVVLDMHADVIMRSPIEFHGNCMMHGNGHSFDLGNLRSLRIAKDARLQIFDTTLKGLSKNTVFCEDDSAQLLLHNVTLQHSDDTLFSRGSLGIHGLVTLQGASSFVYQTKMTSTIYHDSQLLLDKHMTFSYDPQFNRAKNLLYFEDKTATLALNGASFHVTATGIELTRGSLLVDNQSYIGSERHIHPIYDAYGQEIDQRIVDVGITFGKENEDNDFSCAILGGASLTLLPYSTLKNYNTSPESWHLGNPLSSLRLGQRSSLLLYTSIVTSPGLVVFEKDSTLGKTSGAAIKGSMSVSGRLFRQKL